MKKKMTIKKRITLCVVIPVTLLGIIMLILTATLVWSSYKNQIQNSLQGTALATLAAYNQYPGTYEWNDGTLTKGDLVINDTTSMLDSTMLKTNIAITVLYDGQVVVSSAKNSSNYRLDDFTLTSTAESKVFSSETEYFQTNADIDGTKNLAYYVPIFQDGTTKSPIGVIIATTPRSKAMSDIYTIIGIIVGILVLVLVACIITTSKIVAPMVDALKQSIRGVQGLSEGQLDIVIREPVLFRSDEIGDLGRSVESLKTGLRDMLSSVMDSVKSVNRASTELSNTAKDMYQNISEVKSSVDFITDGASTQANDTQSALDSMTYMGDLIIRTGEKAESLNTGADSMKTSGDQAFESIKELRSFSLEVQKAIDLIVSQTNKTNESARQIQSATKFISDIASETDLLSLNASIEAARAGEAGRGFSVVASQIQKLAEQSNAASGSIDQIVDTLIDDATEMVDNMHRFQDVIEQQNEHIELTSQTFNHVLKEITASIENIKEIETMSRDLENSRMQVQGVITTLSNIAQDNVASTEQTNASITEVASRFKSVQHASSRLKTTADTLSDNTKKFTM